MSTFQFYIIIVVHRFLFPNKLYFLGIPPLPIVETHTVVAVVSFLFQRVQHFMFVFIVARWLLYHQAPQLHSRQMDRGKGEECTFWRGFADSGREALLGKILFTIHLPKLLPDHLLLEVDWKSNI